MNTFMQKLGVLTAMLSAFLSVFAYDFEADGICYNITDPTAKEVEVTYGSYGEFYSGDIVVPPSVSYNDVEYSVTAIGSWVFSNCSSLTTITLPNSLTAIGDDAFSNCSSLTGINVDIDNPTYSSIDGILYDKLQTNLICCPEGKNGEVIIPNSVVTIGDQAFYNCHYLTSVTIPNSVTAIGFQAFLYCSSLSKITLPNSLTTIGPGAFSGCIGLTTITLPNSLTAIGKQTFSECNSLTTISLPNSLTTIEESAFWGSGLTTITIPNSVTTIGKSTFAKCGRLTSIDVDANNQTYSSNDGILYDKSQTNLICCPGGKTGEVIIPKFVTTIEAQAFADCHLITITLPNSVTAIGASAFAGCRSLTTITLPNSLTAIEGGAFAGCRSLTTITLPNSLTVISGSAFSGCISLTTIALPNSVTAIGESAFWGCSGLTTIDLPNSVTTIGKSAFYECSNLSSITLSNSVTTIGASAFIYCSNLSSITSLAITPPSCGASVFFSIDKQKCTLYVPAGSVEAYKQAYGWKDFVLVEAVEAGIDSVAAGTADDATEVFNLTGAKVADSLENLPAGIYLVREGSTIRKIAVR